MKRRIAIILVFLMLGTGINVVIAWGVAYRGDVEAVVVDAALATEILQFIGLHENYDPIVERRSRFGFDEFTTMWHVPGESHAIWYFRYGWPFRSFERIERFEDGDNSLFIITRGIRPRTVPLMEFRWPTPMQIYWPGFFANSTLSAITLSLIVFATIKYRRYLRSRRDQCTACGYDLRGAEHDQCPECGMVMKRSGHS